MKRKGFKLTTSGVSFDPPMPNDLPPTYATQADTAEDEFAGLLTALKNPRSAFIQKHSTIIDKFISAVARGINKKPEDLVLDPYGPFIDMLKRWATNYKASKNIPKTSIRLGGKFLLRGDEDTDEEPTEFFAGEPDPPGNPPFKGPIDPKRVMANRGDFTEAYLRKYPALAESDTMTEDSYFLNYLRYAYEQGKNPSESLESIVARIGVMFAPLTFDVAVVNGVATKFNFMDFFLGGGIRYAKTLPKPDLPPKPEPSVVAPPNSQQYPPELLEILKVLLDESTDGFKAAEFVSEYEYTILPKRYSKFFFGPDLIYGIGQSMQRLREAYKFSRGNDELFLDFVNDEQWRDLFIGLVVGVINLQQKISSFNAPQSVIRMIQSNVELTVGKFSQFKRFHRTQPPAKRAVNF